MLKDISGKEVMKYEDLVGHTYLEFEFIGYDKGVLYRLIIDRKLSFDLKLLMFRDTNYNTTIFNYTLGKDTYEKVHNFLVINQLMIDNRDLKLRLDVMYKTSDEQCVKITELENNLNVMQNKHNTVLNRLTEQNREYVKNMNFWSEHLRGYETHDNRRLEEVGDLIKAYYDLMKEKPKTKKTILVVEDGSVDLDALNEDGLQDGKIVIYRQGSTPPFKIEV